MNNFFYSNKCITFVLQSNNNQTIKYEGQFVDEGVVANNVISQLPRRLNGFLLIT